MFKIAILIPSTSRNRDWHTIKDSYLYSLTLKSFLHTYTLNYTYKFYIGIDDDDKFYNDENIAKFKRFCSVMKNIDIEFVKFDNISKGHCTKMWNMLFKKSYNDDYNYFFQCGDDIQFLTKGWVDECVKQLQNHNDIGMTGPINNNNRILTQSFVSRKHMEIFGQYFPEEIINWCCDDWINFVYYPKYIYPLNEHLCLNLGGKPRYTINNDESFIENLKDKTIKLRQECQEIVLRSKKILNNYLSN